MTMREEQWLWARKHRSAGSPNIRLMLQHGYTPSIGLVLELDSLTEIRTRLSPAYARVIAQALIANADALEMACAQGVTA